MGKASHGKHCEETAWIVRDDLADYPILTAELDAVEAFLMPLVKAIMNAEPPGAMMAAPRHRPVTHKRRKSAC